MERLKELNELKHTLIDAAKMEAAKGIENINTEEMGAVVDMIKDLAEAEESCMEACYYETVTEAMTEADGGERMGYDRWRYASGRFAPKGRGTYGYTPMRMDDADWHPAQVMGANMNGTRMDGQTRYGYHEPKEGIDGAMEKMGDLWNDADPSEREKMKSAVKDLLYQMEHTA